MNPIRIAILGQGRSGRNIHGRNLVDRKDKFEIVVTCDLLKERRDRSVEEYGCESVADYKEILKRKDIDLVVNALTNDLHYAVTLEFLQAGFNVLCEKPLCRTVAEADALAAAAKKSGKLFTIFQEYRNMPYVQKILEVSKSGVLGRFVQVYVAFAGFSRRWDWQTIQDMHAGNLRNTGPHPLDLALQIVEAKEAPDQLFSVLDKVNTFGDAEDFAKLVMRWGKGPVVEVDVTCSNAYPTYNCVIQGQNGTLCATTGEVKWKYFDPQKATEQVLIREPLNDEKGLPAYCQETLPWVEEEWKDDCKDTFSHMTRAYYDDLYEVLRNGEKPEVTPEQVRVQIAIMEQAHKQNPLPKM